MRVLRRLARAGDALPLARLLPDEELEPPAGEEAGAGAPVPVQPPSALRRRSAWSSTFAACLELARQGQVRLKQEGEGFAAPILVSPAATAPPSPPRTG